MLPLGQTGATTAGHFISLQQRLESWKHALWMMPPNLQSQPHISKPGILTGQTHPHMPESLHSNKVKVWIATQLHPSIHIFSYPWYFFFFFFFLLVSTTPSCLFVSFMSHLFSLTLSPPSHFLQLQHLCLNVPMHHCHMNICLVTQDSIALYIQYTWGKSCYVVWHGQLVV